ncbi:MAG: glycoside hydrolase family 92 protein [Planctomycetes bacterium]|nr:glycoside hydrolase family 92 protein [Planctomycetota bacterium]
MVGIDLRYDITAPVFDKVEIRISDRYYDGKTFTIVTRNQKPENIYIQSATWNGAALTTPWLPHKELVQGGVLKLELGPNPNKKWGLSE